MSHSDRHDDPYAFALHNSAIDRLKSEGNIVSSAVEEAFCAVPRHLFLPDTPLETVYRDEAIVVKIEDGKVVSSSSQPAVMAIMLEQLGLQPGHRVLEIGTGTGYNAALIAHIIRDSGRLVTIDIDEDLVGIARKHLAAAGFGQVQVICADGALGFAEGAPYDRIILTVGASDVAPAWREQLSPGGRLVLPLFMGGNVQKCIALEQAGDHLNSVSITCCSFIMLRGAVAESQAIMQLGPRPGLYVSAGNAGRIDAEATYRWLAGPAREWQTSIRVTPHEVRESLTLWLALRESRFCSLSAVDELAHGDIVYWLAMGSGEQKRWFTGGLLGEGGLCVLTRAPGESAGPDLPFALFVRSYGLGDNLAPALIGQVSDWDRAGRPCTKDLHVAVYPRDSDYVPSEGETVIHKRHSSLLVHW